MALTQRWECERDIKLFESHGMNMKKQPHSAMMTITIPFLGSEIRVLVVKQKRQRQEKKSNGVKKGMSIFVKRQTGKTFTLFMLCFFPPHTNSKERTKRT